ncbi:CYCD3-2 [Linum perenne]
MGNLHHHLLHDSLYCSEDHHWEEAPPLSHLRQDDTCSWNFNHSPNISINDDNGISPNAHQHLFSWEEDELSALFAKQEENPLYRELHSKSQNLVRARQEATDWILNVSSHFSFSNLTAVLAINYLDRFLLTFHLQTDKPWMTQLTAVACLSVAAKVEETYVPLLLDLQVGESRYVFEPKTIQRMEILVLSALKWRMNPVTPLSFLDYMTRRMGLTNYLCWEFVRRCELIIVSLISDCRSLRYLPSVVATAAMLHVINGLESSVGTDYQSQLLAVLGIDEIMELTSGSGNGSQQWKRKRRMLDSVPGSPNGVMELSFCSDSSNDSSATSSVSSSPEPHRSKKKSRADLDQRFINHTASSSNFIGGIIPRY